MFNSYTVYDVGDLVRLDIDVQVSGAFVDPNHLSLIVQPPNGIDQEFIYGLTGTLIKQATGQYYLNYFVPLSGQYTYRFFCSGTAWGAEEKSFVVRIQKT